GTRVPTKTSSPPMISGSLWTTCSFTSTKRFYLEESHVRVPAHRVDARIRRGDGTSPPGKPLGILRALWRRSRAQARYRDRDFIRLTFFHSAATCLHVPARLTREFYE